MASDHDGDGGALEVEVKVTYAFVTPRGDTHALHAFHKLVPVPNGRGDVALLDELEEALQKGNVKCVLRLAKLMRIAQSSDWEGSPYIHALDALKLETDGSDHG